MFNVLKLFVLVCSLVVFSPVNGSAGKFPNKDTAESRKDIVMGVKSGRSSIVVEQDKSEGIVVERPEKRENTAQDYGPIFVTPEVKVPAQ